MTYIAALFASFIEGSDDLVGVVDTAFRFVAFNAAFRDNFEAIYGHRVETGQYVLECVRSEEEREKLRAAWQPAISGVTTGVAGEFGTSEHRIERFEGRIRPLRAPDGTVIAACYEGRSVGELRAVESELRRKQSEFESIADNIPQLAWMTDEAGRIFWYNRNWYDYTGTTLERMQRDGWSIAHHPDHAARVEEKWLRHLRTGEPWEDTFPLRSASGEFRWFLSRARPMRGSDGRILHWFGTNTDVTEELALHEAHRRAHAELADVLENTGDAFFTLDADFRFTRVNSNHERLSGVPKETCLGRVFWDVFPAASAPESRYWVRFHDVMRERVATKFVEYYEPLELWTDVSVSPTPDGGIAVFYRDVGEVRRALARSERARAELESLFHQSPFPVAMHTGPRLAITLANRSYVELVGRDVVGKDLEEAYLPEEVEFHQELITTVMRERTPIMNREARVTLRKEGHPSKDLFLDVGLYPLLDDHGEAKAVVTVLQDVTQQVEARAVLESSERRFKELAEQLARSQENLLAIVNHAPVVLWALDAEGRYTVSQGRGLAPLDIASNELIGKNHFELFPDPESHAPIRRALAGESFVKEVAIGGITYRSHYGPLFDESGRVVGMSAVSVDVTEAKAAESALLIERENLRNLFRQTPELVCILRGPTHLFEFVNEAHVRVLGFNATGITVREAQPESVEVQDILDAVYRTGITAHLREIPVTVGGSLRYFDLTYAARRNASGDVDGIMILGLEITEQVENRKRIEALAESLQDSLSARDEFLSIASHELRTPLTTLRLQSQLHERARKRGDPSVYQREHVDTLMAQTEKQVSRLGRLIDDMLDVSRIRSGMLSIERERFDLGELAEEVVARLANQFTGVGREPPRLRVVGDLVGDWDRMRMEQVVINLLTNALRYGKGRPVDVLVEPLAHGNGRMARLSVVDRGIGIAKEERAKIFHRFERAVNANEVSGLGLGLFITKQIVEAHGGSVGVESEPGVGSTFIVELPFHAADR